ncbi:conserved hypothetical protein [Ricinus communis]|uniref:CstA N-terminal domain-containing protein n=1 Tax=Ricinus communis TaxID=3988 RepID=B9TKP6_RICCO|nr:conserved hypothetical protein [Ricinus communis]
MLTSGAIVAAWGYFLYIGVIDPNGGVNILWPLFGIANQMLAAIALCVATGILVKSGKIRHAWIAALPLAWLVTITTTAAYQKIMSEDVRVGFFAAAHDMAAKLAAGMLPPEKAAVAPQLIFNQRLDAWLTLFFVTLLWVIVLDMVSGDDAYERYLKHQVAHHPEQTPLSRRDFFRQWQGPSGPFLTNGVLAGSPDAGNICIAHQHLLNAVLFQRQHAGFQCGGQNLCHWGAVLNQASNFWRGEQQFVQPQAPLVAGLVTIGTTDGGIKRDAAVLIPETTAPVGQDGRMRRSIAMGLFVSLAVFND